MEFPWIVSLQVVHNRSYRYHDCAGTVINNYWVLTAGHCVQRYKNNFTDNLIVVFGSLTTDLGFEHKISKIRTHPLNVPNSDDNNGNFADIALIRVAEPIRMRQIFGNYFVNSICLPNKDESFAGSATLVGWGLIRNMYVKTQSWIYEPPKTLQKANDLPLVDLKICREKHLFSEFNLSQYIDDSVICCGGDQRGSWSGDSGGPLIFYRHSDSRAVLIGVSSMTEPYDWSKPSIFTRVSKYIDWIREVITS